MFFFFTTDMRKFLQNREHQFFFCLFLVYRLPGNEVGVGTVVAGVGLDVVGARMNLQKNCQFGSAGLIK